MTEQDLKRMYAAYKAKQAREERQVARAAEADGALYYTVEDLEAVQVFNDVETLEQIRLTTHK